MQLAAYSPSAGGCVRLRGWSERSCGRNPNRQTGSLSSSWVGRGARITLREEKDCKSCRSKHRCYSANENVMEWRELEQSAARRTRGKWTLRCSQQEYWTEEREVKERQKLADLKAELEEIKGKMQMYRYEVDQLQIRQDRLKRAAGNALNEVDEVTARKLLEKKSRLHDEMEEKEEKIELLQSLAVKLTEVISKQELLIISKQPIQTRSTPEPSVEFVAPAAQAPRSVVDVTEQFVKWEREALEALIDLTPDDASGQEHRKSFESQPSSVHDNLQRLRQDLELAIRKRDLYRREENFAKAQQCTTVITELNNLIARLEDFDTESKPLPRDPPSSTATLEEQAKKNDENKNDNLEWFEKERQQEEDSRIASDVSNRPALEDDLNKKIKILVNMKNRGKDFNFTDLLEVRRLCAQLGTTLFIDNPNIRSSIYRSGLSFVIFSLLEGNLRVGKGVLGMGFLTAGNIVKNFLIPFAKDLGLDARVAVNIIEAGVSAKLKSLMLLAVAKLNLEDKPMAEEAIADIIVLLTALPFRPAAGNLIAITSALQPFITDEKIYSILQMCKRKGASDRVLSIIEFCLRSL